MNDRYCVNVLNFGFDTTVAITINKIRDQKGRTTKNAYTQGVLTALLKSMKNHYTVTADGELLNPEGVSLLCTLGNGQYVGGSFQCAPKAKLDDGLMEVCVVKPVSRFKFVKILPIYTNGQHLDNQSVSDIFIYRQAKRVHVKAAPGFAYSLDGEIIYSDDFIVEVMPNMLNLAVPVINN